MVGSVVCFVTNGYFGLEVFLFDFALDSNCKKIIDHVPLYTKLLSRFCCRPVEIPFLVVPSLAILATTLCTAASNVRLGSMFCSRSGLSCVPAKRRNRTLLFFVFDTYTLFGLASRASLRIIPDTIPLDRLH